MSYFLELNKKAKRFLHNLLPEVDKQITASNELIEFFIELCFGVEEKRISEDQADHLFGYFTHFNFKQENLNEIVLDGASLRLPKNHLSNLDISIESIHSRLIEIKP